MIHLIFDNLTFNEEFKDFFKKSDFHPPLNKEYQTLAIIGCQSSGKSTLLNHIFSTDFEVMDESKGRGQTTQGIWSAVNKEFNTIIFDVEGTDAKERGDNRFKFEQCSSLFALVMADVLIMNMWTSDIGRYTASNYGVLKIVFEMNLKLFQQESAKKIVIVFRDFDENTEDKKRLSDCILDDIRKIWTEIKKPEKFKDCPPEQFFTFDFLTLPHKFYFEDKFLEGVENIKKRLRKPANEEGMKEYLFNHVKYEKNVPIDGMFKYTWDMWSNIINNKDLNIPSQKEMLAQFKCNEIKDVAIASVEKDISDLEIESSSKAIDDFKSKCEAISSSALAKYDETAKDYLPHIYKDIRMQLNVELSEKLYTSFANQIKRLIPKYQKNFRIELEEVMKENDNFYECTKKLNEKYIKELEEEVKKIKVYDTWEIGADNEQLFSEIIEHEKEISLGNKKETLVNQLINLSDDNIVSSLETLNDEFWKDANVNCLKNFNYNFTAFKNSMIDQYNLNDEEYITFFKGVEDDFFTEMKDSIVRKMKDLKTFAVEAFRSQFWNDEGVPRTWNKLTESFIDELFNKIKPNILKVFDTFKKYRMISHPFSLLSYTPIDNEDELTNKVNDLVDEKLKAEEEKFVQFLSDTEITNLKLKFDDEVNDILEDAKRRHDNIKKVNIPIWAWVLLIYISYKDIWNIITGKGIFIVLICGGLYGLLYAVGLGKAPLMFLNLLQSQLGGMLTGKK